MLLRKARSPLAGDATEQGDPHHPVIQFHSVLFWLMAVPCVGCHFPGRGGAWMADSLREAVSLLWFGAFVGKESSPGLGGECQVVDRLLVLAVCWPEFML